MARFLTIFTKTVKLTETPINMFLSEMKQPHMGLLQKFVRYTGKLISRSIFSSPEQNAQVSYSRPFSSGVRRPSSVIRRPSCVVRRPSSVVRRASSVNFLHFHLLLENAWVDFNQTWQESSLGVGDSNLFKSYVWPPWGPRGRAPKGQNHANFKHLLLQIQKENGQVM